MSRCITPGHKGNKGQGRNSSPDMTLKPEDSSLQYVTEKQTQQPAMGYITTAGPGL